MSDDSSADVADDEEFFDEPLNRRSAKPSNKKAASERRPSLSPDVVNASRSPHHSSHGHSFNDESNSSEGKRRTSVDEESLDQKKSSSSVKCAVVIPLPPGNHHDEDQTDDSKTAEGRSTAHKESVQEQPSHHRKKNKKTTGKQEAKTVVHESRSHCKKNSFQGDSVTPRYKSGYSSDEEKHHLETGCHSRRPDSSASTSTSRSQQRGTYRISRALSAPVRRPPQSRAMSGFSNGSRMDVKMLLESLLQAENSRPRRKSVADPVEFRRKRNYTFSDQRLELIERENKRLLDKIVTIHYSQPSYSWASQKRATPVKPTIPFPDVTRIKQLEKIEKENSVRHQ